MCFHRWVNSATYDLEDYLSKVVVMSLQSPSGESGGGDSMERRQMTARELLGSNDIMRAK